MKFIETKKLKKTDAKNIVKVFLDLFLRYGNLKNLITDNGPLFDSTEF